MADSTYERNLPKRLVIELRSCTTREQVVKALEHFGRAGENVQARVYGATQGLLQGSTSFYHAALVCAVYGRK